MGGGASFRIDQPVLGVEGCGAADSAVDDAGGSPAPHKTGLWRM